MQRRPMTERWSRNEAEKVSIWPWDRKKNAQEEGSADPMVIPAKTEEERAAEPPRPVKPKEANVHRSVYIQPEDLGRFGYTSDCRRCTLMRERKSARGIRHNEACRSRIMTELTNIGDPRIEKQEEKEREYLAERVERATIGGPGGAEGGGETVEVDVGELEPPAASSSSSTPEPPAAPQDEAPNGEEMDLDLDLLSASKALLLTFLRKDKDIEVPDKKAEEICALYSMLLVNGVKEPEARAKIWEFYSPPRVTAMAASARHLNVNGDRSFDLRKDKEGKEWDFTLAEHRARARRMVSEEKPYITTGSPPCTDFCSLNININHPKMEPQVRRRRMIEAMTHLRFCIEIYQMQLDGGRHFLHEHPSTATSWYVKEMQKLRQDPRVGETIGHMCMYGMTQLDKNQQAKPVKKSTRWMSSAGELLSKLGRRCVGHEHIRLEGGRPAAAAVYPPELCMQILEGIDAQWNREGRGIPGSDRGIYSVEKFEVDYEWMNQLRRKGYWDSVTGDKLPEEETEAARQEEIGCMNKWNIWDIVDVDLCWQRTGKSPISGRWVDHNKGDESNPNVRSRYVAQEVARWKDATLFAATPPLEALRLLLSSIARDKKRKLLLIDVRKAYLHAVAEREVYVQLPKEMNLQGKCGRLNRCLYGTRDAALQWEALYSKELISMGFMKGKASPCCFHHSEWDVRCVVHGDDFTFEGEDGGVNEVEEKLRRYSSAKSKAGLEVVRVTRRKLRY